MVWLGTKRRNGKLRYFQLKEEMYSFILNTSGWTFTVPGTLKVSKIRQELAEIGNIQP